MADISGEVQKIIDSGDLPTKIELPARTIEGNPNILEPGDLPFIIQLAALGQAVRTRKATEELLRRRAFKGEIETLDLTASNLKQKTQELPSLISVFITNYGPNTVYITFNSGLNKPLQILSGESRTINYSDADTRIGSIYYWCDAGLTASVRVEGYY